MKSFTVALALAAAASAAVLPRQEFETPREQPHGPYGYWSVRLSGNATNDYYYLVTDYYNDGTFKFPDSYTTTCFHESGDPPLNPAHKCDKLGLDWSYIDGRLNLSQTITDGDVVTTFAGSAYPVTLGDFYMNVTTAVPA